MRLNGTPLSSFELPPEPTTVTIPLALARHGRNKLRLEYAAPRAARENHPGWYRSLSGNPALAIEVSTLTLRPL